MASAAEQFASSFNLSTLSKATELRKRIWFTLGALIIYRFGTYIPVPGVDPAVMAEMLNRHGSGILGMFNMFTGGALGRMTVFALNIMPYISASIIVQLMSSAIPALETLKKEGESGRKKMNQYTRYLTVLIALVQSYGISVGLEGMHGNGGAVAVADPGWFFRSSCVITLVGGTMFLMWLGEQITARGIGNGTSLIIFSGIVANLPTALGNLLELGRTGGLSPVFIVSFLVIAGAVIAFIVFMERAQRRVVIQYPKRQVGQRMFGGDSTHMPLKINTAGVIPPIFASSILHRPTGPRSAALHVHVCRHDHFLLVFLYRGRVQPAGDRRQSEEIWRLHSRHPPWHQHGGLFRHHIDAAYDHRLAVSGCRLPVTGDPDQQVRRAVLLRRHQPYDHRFRYDGHHYPDAVPSFGAPV
jgi:preprotein translocase subunit SecY